MAEELNQPNISPPPERTPQQELEDLLRGSTKLPRPSPDIRVPREKGSRRPNLLVGGIIVLALLLLIGTGYFVVRGVGFTQGHIILELNENAVSLTVDGHSYGEIDSGEDIRLKAGQHSVLLAKEGYLELSEKFELGRGEERTLTFELLPVPVIELVVDKVVQYARLNADGSEISYFDPEARTFKSIGLKRDEFTGLASRDIVQLFRGSFSELRNVAWSPVAQSAIVKLAGRPQLSNLLDNRNVRGAYVPLGERPSQGSPNFNGVSTWLFDDNQVSASGWQPVLLSDSIRAATFNADGSLIAYIYEPVGGEYSLVQAQSDGTEWERKITNLSRFANPQLSWGVNDRYLFIEDGGKLFAADMIAGEINDVFTERISGSHFDISASGDRIAYLAQPNGLSNIELRVYDLFSGEASAIEDVAVDQNSLFAWVGMDSILLVSTDQSFMNIDIETGSKLRIPFVGAGSEIRIQEMDYSLSTKVLMLVTDKGIAILKV